MSGTARPVSLVRRAPLGQLVQLFQQLPGVDRPPAVHGSPGPFADIVKPVRGTAITYQDLALKFLYWPNARVIGADFIRTRNCWKIQLQAPGGDSQYGSILLWVDKDNGALMRMEGYDSAGKMIKRFEVVSAQKIENRWYLKQMRVERIDPQSGRVIARTYLEINK